MTSPTSQPGSPEHLAGFAPYSYRTDPQVPDFPDADPLIVFDGHCLLCSRFAQFVARCDKDQHYRFASAQSPLGQALFHHYGLDTRDFETNLLIADGRPHGKLDAFIRIVSPLRRPFGMLRALRLLPAPVSNWIYDRIARNRYRLFGTTGSCHQPSDQLRSRIID
ncbi:MAG: hypothetical protein RLZ98_845 [Pseudomonadota bacterium]|jgi:predicted DCC family thiol-disulfide oxidoreductase YuxK